MSSEMIISNLRRFNRKERFYLVGAALDNPKFKLGKQFWKKLQECLGLQEEVPEDAFVAMDYHLNWVYASLFLADKEMDLDEAVRKAFPNPEEIIKGNQEDIDLLIAYPGDEGCHLLFLEAKGDSGFNNDQLKSKADRLRKIFGEDGCCWSGVKPHFAIISRKKPTDRLNWKKWPKWMRRNGEYDWLELDWPCDLALVSRSDESGQPSAKGHCWTVLPRKHVKNAKQVAETEDKT